MFDRTSGGKAVVLMNNSVNSAGAGVLVPNFVPLVLLC